MKWFTEHFKKLQNHLFKAVERFPETLLLCGAFAVIAIIINHLGYGQPEEEQLRKVLENVLMTLALGIPFSGVVVLIAQRLAIYQSEPHDLKNPLLSLLPSNIVRFGGMAILAGIMAAFYFSIPEPVPNLFVWRFAIIMVSGYLAFSLVHFFPKEDRYPLSVLKIIVDAAITTLYTLVLFAGISAILFALDELLGVNIDGDLYGDVFLLLVGFFSPAHFLGAFIKQSSDIDDYGFSKVFKVLFGTIVTSLLLLYTTILYAYFIKMIFDGGIPKGMVAQLVMWYSIVALGTLFLTESLSEENALVKWFQRFMPLLMLVPIGMMFLAIYIRIADYGITVKRYFVVALGIWVLGNVIYRIISRHKLPQVMIFTVIAVSLFSLYGPWSAYPISIANQNARFEALLVETGLLSNGVITPQKDLSDKEIQDLRDTIQYFQYQHSLVDLKYLPKDFDPATQMKTVFGFEYWGGESPQKYLNIWSDEFQGKKMVEGTNSIYVVNWNDYKSGTEALTLEKDSLALDKLGKVSWRDNLGKDHEFNISLVIDQIDGATKGDIYLKGADAWKTITVDGQELQVFVQNINAQIDEQGTFSYNQMKLMIFVK